MDSCLTCEHYKDYGGNVGRCIKNKKLVNGDSWCSEGRRYKEQTADPCETCIHMSSETGCDTCIHGLYKELSLDS